MYKIEFIIDYNDVQFVASFSRTNRVNWY